MSNTYLNNKLEQTKNNIIDLMNSVNTSNDLVSKCDRVVNITTKDLTLKSLIEILKIKVLELKRLLSDFDKINIDSSNIYEINNRFNILIEYIRKHLTRIVVYIKRNKLYS